MDKSELYSYGYGVMARGVDFYITATEYKLDDKDVDHSVAFESAGGNWYGWSTEFRTVAVAYAPDPGLFFLIGQNGKVEVTSPIKAWDEIIDATDNGPSSIRAINTACTIGQHVYAAGMRRQVYRRKVDEKTWSRFDAGCFTMQGTTTVLGFNAIHGLDESEIFAVGFQGEIWRCLHGEWAQVSSPTDTSLYVVHQLATGDVLIGGGLGLLLRGNASGFAIIPHQQTTASITGIATYDGRTFIAAEDGKLFELTGDQLITVNDIPSDSDGGGQLHANNMGMLYVRYDSVMLWDGQIWQNVSPPDNA